jgi:hypothetical protein
MRFTTRQKTDLIRKLRTAESGESGEHKANNLAYEMYWRGYFAGMETAIDTLKGPFGLAELRDAFKAERETNS